MAINEVNRKHRTKYSCQNNRVLRFQPKHHADNDCPFVLINHFRDYPIEYVAKPH